MYKKVLVSLDGSALAECTLPHVIEMAKKGNAGEIILFSVAEMKIPINYSTADDIGFIESFDYQEFWNSESDRFQKYLADVKSKLKLEGIEAETVLIKGYTPTQAILDFVKEKGVELIVIATHGYTGMKKLLMGSVAFRVLHESPVPVLLIRPESCRV